MRSTARTIDVSVRSKRSCLARSARFSARVESVRMMATLAGRRSTFQTFARLDAVSRELSIQRRAGDPGALGRLARVPIGRLERLEDARLFPSVALGAAVRGARRDRGAHRREVARSQDR